jgi:DNA-binding transcriptional ArsR family regulator
VGVRSQLALSVRDLAETRFSISPMWEVVTSFRALVTVPVPEIQRSWAAQVRPRLLDAGLDRGWLADMIPAAGHLPDFLNPPTAAACADIEDELAAIRRTDPTLVRRDLDIISGDGGWHGRRLSARLKSLHREPERHLPRVAGEIETYWQLALAPYWARIRTVLEADVFHRARQVAERGTAAALNDLHATVRWDDGTLLLTERHCAIARIATAAGLLLVPSAFAWPRVLTRSVGADPPQIAYPARGSATLWEQRAQHRAPALARVIGNSRVLLLTELESPASTTDLADRSGLSAAGVSQHLTALRAAGLVSCHRAGRSVLYARTAVADALLAAQS